MNIHQAARVHSTCSTEFKTGRSVIESQAVPKATQA